MRTRWMRIVPLPLLVVLDEAPRPVTPWATQGQQP